MKKSLRTLALAALALPALAAAPAYAQDEAAKPLDISFSLAAVSDYRFRGLSLSGKDPAIQPQISVNHKSGLYLTAWGSNISDNGGDDIEIDLTAGIARDVGALSLNASAVYYVYPGASGDNYIEFIGSVGTAVGAGDVTMTFAYAPSQGNLDNQDNVYVAIGASHPLTEKLSINGSFGIEDGAFGDNKKDWSLGADLDVGYGIVVGAKYIDTARTGGDTMGKATGVLSISKEF